MTCDTLVSPDEPLTRYNPKYPAYEKVFKKGFAPGISTNGLLALLQALEADSPDLIRGGTLLPVPYILRLDDPVEAACAIGYCGWKGEGLNTVNDVEHYFGNQCSNASQRMGQELSSGWFLNWWDDNPREVVVPKLRDMVVEVLEERKSNHTL